MIFGPNFGGPAIPRTGAFRKFPPRIRRVWCNHFHLGNWPNTGTGARIGSFTCCLQCQQDGVRHGRVQFVAFRLEGIAQSPEERDAMKIQADNGHRKIFVVSKQTAGGLWYGIYTY